MKKLDDVQTTTYQYNENLQIDLVKKKEKFPDGSIKEIWDSWIFNPEYGIKTYMFGVEPEQCVGGWEGFIKLVMLNADDYIPGLEEYTF